MQRYTVLSIGLRRQACSSDDTECRRKPQANISDTAMLSCRKAQTVID